MKKNLLLFIVVYLIPHTLVFSYSEPLLPTRATDTLYSGYTRDVAGEILEYHSCHPEARTSLLIRCLNKEDYIEWETAIPDLNKTKDTVTFCWIGGFSTGTSTANHSFHLFINGEENLTFTTFPNMNLSGWKVSGKKGTAMDFLFISEDHVKDHFGYFFLKVPKVLLSGNTSLNIKVKGDASGSRDWYMTMRYSLKSRLELLPEEALIRGRGQTSFQRIKLSLDHFDREEEIRIVFEKDSVIDARLHFGVNDIILAVRPAVQEEKRTIRIHSNHHQQQLEFLLSPVRQFKVCLLPHSHVDIGYTALQDSVAKRHADHIRTAMRLIRKTAGNPENSKFKWNVEMLWEAEAFLQRASDKEKKEFISMVKKGDIELQGMYAGVMTGLCRDEELFHLFDCKQDLEKKYELNIESAMITDIPGYSWGLVTAMAQSGIRYFSVGPNVGDRIGNTIKAWGDKPFYWRSPSGKERVLFWMSSRGYSLFHQGSLAKTEGSQILAYLHELKESSFPYDLVQLRYTILGDNGPPDSLLSDYVRTWNEKYISPVLSLSTTTSLFREFEEKYGPQLPEQRGDFTPYWEDGAGSTALETAMNRRSAERLVQGETVYCLADPFNYPFTDARDGWNHVLLFSEHTWGAWNSTSDPDLPFVKEQWQVKKGYAEAASLISTYLTEKLKNKMKSGPNENGRVTVFNTSSWVRSGMVYIQASLVPEGSNQLVNDKGVAFPIQNLKTGLACAYVTELPPLGYQRYRFQKSDKTTSGQLRIDVQSIENKDIIVRIDSLTGDIASLIEKKSGKEWVDGSHPHGFNGYSYSGTNASSIRKPGKCQVRISENGPVMVCLEITSVAPGCISLVREISLNVWEPVLYIKDRVIKSPVREKENVRFSFPFSLENPEVRMDMAGFVLEPGKNQLSGSNMNFYTVQRWLDVSNDKEGICLATPDAPLWEIGGMTGEAWMKAGNEKNWMTTPLASSVLYSWVMNNSWHTNFKADQDGEVSFHYAIKPHRKYHPVETYRFGVEISQPLLCFPGTVAKDGYQLPPPNPHPDIVINSLAINPINKTEVLFRFYNVSDTEVSYLPFPENLKIRECDPYGNLFQESTGPLRFNPHEIKTISAGLIQE